MEAPTNNLGKVERDEQRVYTDLNELERKREKEDRAAGIFSKQRSSAVIVQEHNKRSLVEVTTFS